MKQRIYLDNNATTALDSRVFEAMVQDLKGGPLNPSSVHFFGQTARNLLISARRTIASYLHVDPEEIVFTSGGTEALNHCIQNFANGHIITTDIEHSAIYKTIRELKIDATFIQTGTYGAATVQQIKAALRPDTKAIILSAVNGETGVKTDIQQIAQFAEKHSIPFIVDGVALMGKEPFEIPSGVTAMCFSAHKFHGPKGTGFLFLRNGFSLSPFQTGGMQEHQKRAGTENLSGILGMARAVSLLQEELPAKTQHMLELRNHFEKSLMDQLKDIQINGEGPRVVNTSNLYFPNVDGESLLLNLDLAGIAASHGSACTAGALEPSRVLLNMSYDRKRARSSVRFSFSRQTTKEEIDRAIIAIVKIVHQSRNL